MERTWFGVYRIMEMPGDERVPGRVRLFFHGTTLHGFDWLKPDGSVESRTGYHAPEGPHGDVMRALQEAAAKEWPCVMGVVGLGAGSLLCYAQARRHADGLGDRRRGCAGLRGRALRGAFATVRRKMRRSRWATDAC